MKQSTQVKKCCKYHDDFFQAWLDADVEQPTDLNDCGMAGMGAAVLCCKDCPEASFYNANSGKPGWHSSHRPVEYILDVIKQYAKEENL